MASVPPYTYIQCPCVTGAQSSDTPHARGTVTGIVPAGTSFDSGGGGGGGASGGHGHGRSASASAGKPGGGASLTGQSPLKDLTSPSSSSSDMLDPRAARSSFGLYPLEHLLYCENCNQIRCPRCVSEEVLTVFCPNCLFEVPNTNLRTEGNRWVLSL
jgi:hypothetical protein